MSALDGKDLGSAAEVISKHIVPLETFVEKELKPNYVNYVHDHLYAEDN